jgi:hypothetical protein
MDLICCCVAQGTLVKVQLFLAISLLLVFSAMKTHLRANLYLLVMSVWLASLCICLGFLERHDRKKKILLELCNPEKPDQVKTLAVTQT